MMWDKNLISFFPIWISNCLGTVFEKSVFSPMLCGAHLCIVSRVYCLACYSITVALWYYRCTNIILIYHSFRVNVYMMIQIFTLFYICFLSSKPVLNLLLSLKMYPWNHFEFSIHTDISLLSHHLFSIFNIFWMRRKSTFCASQISRTMLTW